MRIETENTDFRKYSKESRGKNKETMKSQRYRERQKKKNPKNVSRRQVSYILYVQLELPQKYPICPQKEENKSKQINIQTYVKRTLCQKYSQGVRCNWCNQSRIIDTENYHSNTVRFYKERGKKSLENPGRNANSLMLEKKSGWYQSNF